MLSRNPGLSLDAQPAFSAYAVNLTIFSSCIKYPFYSVVKINNYPHLERFTKYYNHPKDLTSFIIFFVRSKDNDAKEKAPFARLRLHRSSLT